MRKNLRVAPESFSGRQMATAAGRLLFPTTLVLLISALLFGGASRENAPQLLLLQMESVAVLLLVLLRVLNGGMPRHARLALTIPAACIALLVLQMIPLPQAVWEGLPGRDLIATAAQAAGVGSTSTTLALVPGLTHQALLFLLPPLAIYLSCLFATERQLELHAQAVVAVAIAGLFVGGLQLAGGPESRFFFYETTNTNSSVGFFANRNHYSSFLVIAFLFAVVAFMAEFRRGRRLRPATVLWVAMAVLTVAGVFMTRSRAGVLLLVVALAAAALIIYRSDMFPRGRAILVLGLGTATIGGLMLMLVASGTLDRFAPRVEQDERAIFAPRTFEAALQYLPLGSGVGSFESVYRTNEPVHVMGDRFVNHAHNDYLELLLETGLPGMLLLALFLGWFGWRTYRVWSGHSKRTAWTLRRAASVGIVIILAHSVVDYPLRTEAMICVFAFACGLLARPRPEQEAQLATRSGRGRKRQIRDTGGGVLSGVTRVSESHVTIA